jgi:tRNA pseudouridine38-40 synthase
VREIQDVSIARKDNIMEITITANDFLHNMARYMVGMLLDVGNGLKKPEAIQDILSGGEVQVSFPAESYGLFLKDVLY